NYNLGVTINHYACMVDFLGGMNRWKTQSLIENAPFHLQTKYLLWIHCCMLATHMGTLKWETGLHRR
ncbi:hypothetical protein PanWU01x14_252800, partial [Parasponia andersonii]